MSWLAEHLETCGRTEETEGYLYGRGAKDDFVEQCFTWRPLDEPRLDDPIWVKRYGERGLGEWLNHRLVIPLYSPRNELLGFEARSTRQKRISEYLLPEASWVPVFLGMSPEVVQKLWSGGNAWIVEGAFDLTAMSWVIPEGDVVLGTLRAKLGRRHVEFLKRFCRGTVYMVYDNDEGGQKGMYGWVDESGKKVWGAMQSLEFSGIRAQDVAYKGGDPGEIWDSGGVEAMQAAFPSIHLI